MSGRSWSIRARQWAEHCFGRERSDNKVRRTFRFIEEAVELAQAVGASKQDVMTLVDYVYARPVGEPRQEVGGTALTLATLCYALRIDLDEAAEDELARVWTIADKIRAKELSAPKDSPLPGNIDTK